MHSRNVSLAAAFSPAIKGFWEENMGRSILLLLLGVPLPIVILLALFWH
jgi:hypothetical protein